MKFSDFGFQENPFSITPDPRYLFLSRGHEESLAHLIYGTGPNGGFVQLTGEVGTGKTMLVRSLLVQKLEDVDIALVLNPRLSRRDFMAAICDELGVTYQGPPYQLKQLNDNLSRHLLKTHAQGRHTVLVIDEAQNLSPRVLEQIRLLTNLETSSHKLLRIILVGQPELQQLLARKDLRQVDQRITARYHLSPLSRTETVKYIRHRLSVAGLKHDLFTPLAVKLVYLLTRGVPRRINTLCERALLAVFTIGTKRVTPAMVWRASREIKGRYAGITQAEWLLAGFILLGSAAFAWWGMRMLEQQPDSIAALTRAGQKVLPISKLGEAIKLSDPNLSQESTGGNGEHAPVGADDTPGSSTQRIPALLTAANSSGTPAVADKWFLSQRLFELWNQPVGEEVKDICHQALLVGLRCLSGSTNWEGLRRLNRPLLCQLKQDDLSMTVLVKKMLGNALIIEDGNSEYRLDKESFIRHWQGDFVMLWNPPSGGALVGPGSTGEIVTWLRERLSLADGKPVPVVVGKDLFDDGLKSRLQRFQYLNGLTADGIAGAWTMILLNNLQLPPGTPTLKGES